VTYLKPTGLSDRCCVDDPPLRISCRSQSVSPLDKPTRLSSDALGLKVDTRIPGGVLEYRQGDAASGKVVCLVGEGEMDGDLLCICTQEGVAHCLLMHAQQCGFSPASQFSVSARGLGGWLVG
jgi:hypothetical protein